MFSTPNWCFFFFFFTLLLKMLCICVFYKPVSFSATQNSYAIKKSGTWESSGKESVEFHIESVFVSKFLL